MGFPFRPDRHRKGVTVSQTESNNPIITHVPESLDVEVKLPTIKSGGSARVDVTPGTVEHEVMADYSDHPDPIIEERRKHPAPTQITVQSPPSGGLSGWPATIANMSAIAFVMLLMFMMYRDFVSTIRDRDVLVREEMRTNRESGTAEARLGRESNASDAKLMAGAIASLTNSNNAMASEFRTSRISMETRLDKLLGVIPAKLPPDPQDREEPNEDTP